MKILLTSILLLYSIFLFQEFDIEKMKNDEMVIKLKKLNKELIEGNISGRYKIPPNYVEIRKSYGVSPAKEKLIKALKENGMINAEEYINKVFTQVELMGHFFKKYPAIQKLNPMERSKFLQKLLME